MTTIEKNNYISKTLIATLFLVLVFSVKAETDGQKTLYGLGILVGYHSLCEDMTEDGAKEFLRVLKGVGETQKSMLVSPNGLKGWQYVKNNGCKTTKSLLIKKNLHSVYFNEEHFLDIRRKNATGNFEDALTELENTHPLLLRIQNSSDLYDDMAIYWNKEFSETDSSIVDAKKIIQFDKDINRLSATTEGVGIHIEKLKERSRIYLNHVKKDQNLDSDSENNLEIKNEAQAEKIYEKLMDIIETSSAYKAYRKYVKDSSIFDSPEASFEKLRRYLGNEKVLESALTNFNLPEAKAIREDWKKNRHSSGWNYGLVRARVNRTLVYVDIALNGNPEVFLHQSRIVEDEEAIKIAEKHKSISSSQ